MSTVTSERMYSERVTVGHILMGVSHAHQPLQHPERCPQWDTLAEHIDGTKKIIERARKIRFLQYLCAHKPQFSPAKGFSGSGNQSDFH